MNSKDLNPTENNPMKTLNQMIESYQIHVQREGLRRFPYRDTASNAGADKNATNGPKAATASYGIPRV